MKTCDLCGSKNATRALFCSTCGEPFETTDDATVVAAVRASSRRRSGGSEIVVVPEPSRADQESEKLSEATSVFASTLASSFRATALAFFHLLARLLRPALIFVGALIRDMTVRALSPASSWNPAKAPDFLWWGIVQALLWRFPASLIGITYAVLARDARRSGEYDRALDRASRARAWLLIDLVFGIGTHLIHNLIAR